MAARDRLLATVTIDGRIWEVWSMAKARMRKRGADGTATVDDEGRGRIEIAQGQTGQARLDTLLHELAHALDWDEESEAEIEARAEALAAVLWADGWRRLDS